MDQVVGFVEDVVLPASPTGKVHIVGNSVGGHLAAFVAAKISARQQQTQESDNVIKSLCLLNPTPFWGLNLPGWNGQLPAPFLPKLIGRFLFDQIRNLSNIERFLEAVYVNSNAFSMRLMEQIRDCTMGPGGHAAFASILWSPPISMEIPSSSSSQKQETVNNFYDCLNALEQRSSSGSTVPILLVFGRDDPWCKPALARRMLQANKQARYIELSRVGHCPNHEAPVATAHILKAWWSRQHAIKQDMNRPTSLFPRSKRVVIQESWGQTDLVEMESHHEIPLSLADRLTTAII